MTTEEIQPEERIRARLAELGRQFVEGLAVVGCAVTGHPPLPRRDREEPE